MIAGGQRIGPKDILWLLGILFTGTDRKVLPVDTKSEKSHVTVPAVRLLKMASELRWGRDVEFLQA